MKISSLRILGAAMIIGWCCVVSGHQVAAEVVDTDTKPIGLEVVGTATVSPTPDGSPISSPTVQPTATAPAVNKLPDTGNQGGSDDATAALIASAAILSAVAAYGVRRGAQRAA